MSSHSFTKSLLLFGLILFIGVFVLTMPPESAGQSPAAAANSSSLLFVENVGQFDEAVHFRLDGTGGTFWLTEDGLWLSVLEPAAREVDEPSGWQRPGQNRPDGERQGVNLKLTFVGANPRPRLEAFEQRPARFSYFMGNDPAGWHSGVATWGGVRYVELYPGINLELSGEGGRLAPRLICQSNCRERLQQVALEIEGAETVEVVEGQLRIGTAVGKVLLPLFHLEGGHGVADVSPRVEGNRVVMPFGEAVRIPKIPEDEPADLLYSTFLGGNAFEIVFDLAVDDGGASYLTGVSSSIDFPTTAGSFVDNSGSDAFVFITKLNSTGSDVLYTAFLGGNSYDEGQSITIDGSGAVYITGQTDSTNFPTTFDAYDRTHNGDSDGFAAKVVSDGTILSYGTYLGGSDYELPVSVAVDANGIAYVAGFTYSWDYPKTVNGLPYAGNGDGFVTKVNGTGSDLLFSTFLGGTQLDYLNGLTLDSNGSPYITGATFSPDFPGSATASTQTRGSDADGFISQFDSSGTLSYSTFFGGTNFDEGMAIKLDADGAIYVTGGTNSSDFPVTAGAYDTTFNSTMENTPDVFVLKVNNLGTDIIYGTFIGGAFHEYGFGLDVGSDGSVYATGMVSSADFPTTPTSFDTSLNGERDAFILRLDGAGSSLLYSTFLGGSLSAYEFEEDAGLEVVAGIGGSVYVAGAATTTDFPTTAGAFDTIFGGEYEGFVAKLMTGDNSTATPTATASATDTATPTPTLGPTWTPTPSPTGPTPVISPTPTETAGTETPTPTWTPPATASATPTASSTPTATATTPAVTVYKRYLPAIVTNP
jgi:hypothetical protein